MKDYTRSASFFYTKTLSRKQRPFWNSILGENPLHERLYTICLPSFFFAKTLSRNQRPFGNSTLGENPVHKRINTAYLPFSTLKRLATTTSALFGIQP
jgi:hypothetical protein